HHHHHHHDRHHLRHGRLPHPHYQPGSRHRGRWRYVHPCLGHRRLGRPSLPHRHRALHDRLRQRRIPAADPHGHPRQHPDLPNLGRHDLLDPPCRPTHPDRLAPPYLPARLDLRHHLSRLNHRGRQGRPDAPTLAGHFPPGRENLRAPWPLGHRCHG